MINKFLEKKCNTTLAILGRFNFYNIDLEIYLRRNLHLHIVVYLLNDGWPFFVSGS